MHTPTPARESDEDASWGARTLAALGACELTAQELDEAQRTVERRLGVGDSFDAVLALIERPKPPDDLLAYIRSLTDGALQVQAEKRRKRQQQRASQPRAAAPLPFRCEHGHNNGLKRASDGTSSCVDCSRAALQPAAAAS